MKKLVLSILFVGSLLVGSKGYSQGVQQITNPTPQFISPNISSAPNKLFVRLKDYRDVDMAYMEQGQDQFVNSDKRFLYRALTDARIASVIEPMSVLKKRKSDVLQITLHNDNDLDRYMSDLAQDPNVLYVERVPLPQSFSTPNDPLAGDQYHLELVGAIEAWSKSTENANTPKNDIVIAIIDDGVLITHEDLKDNMFINETELNGTPGIDDDNNGYVDDIYGWDASGDEYYNGDPDPNPPSSEATRFNFSHGTHCAGIAAARTDNSKGVASVSDNRVKILAVKATADDTPNARAITHSTEALMYAIEMKANVVSMSYGGYGYSATVARLIREATEDYGMFFVAAAGNDNVNLASYPAGYDNVMAVANTTSNDVKSPSSQYGPWIDISAPGTDIISTVAADDGNTNGDYAPYTGTSMSCPMVAGAAAFLLTQDSTISPLQMRALLMGTATDINPRNPNYQNALGAGRINMSAAMDALLSDRPIAAFDILSDNGIVNQDIQLVNLSFADGATYEWNFGDSETSTSSADTISHAYDSIPTLGTYLITLKVTDASGRSNTYRRGITMIAGPPEGPEESVPFSTDFLSDTGGFVTETEYLDGGTGDDVWEWARARGDNLNSGDSTVWVTAASGGVPLRSYSAILYTPIFDFSEEEKEYKISFTKSMETTYCNAPAACQMQYTTDNGGTWRLLGEPNDGLGYGWYNKSPDDACAIHPIIFENQTGWLGNYENDSTAYNVSFLAGNDKVRFRFVYRHESAFQIEDTDDGFMIRDFIVTKEEPTADFNITADVEYIKRPIQFVYNSGGAIDYLWDFGDGNTSTEPSPTHTYETTGEYEVELYINNDPSRNHKDTIPILGVKSVPFDLADGGDLEGDDLLFYSLNLAGTDLELGSSSIEGKNGTLSGDNAYVLGKDTAGYQVPTGFYLYTSVFDLPDGDDDTQRFSFALKQDVKEQVDGMFVEFSNDYGRSWRLLGSYVDPSWNNELSSEYYWSGENIPIMTGTTDNEWETKYIPLAGFEGEKVAFRLFFVAASQDSSGGIGLAMDNFRVVDYEPQVTSLNYTIDKTIVGLNSEVTFTSRSDVDSALVGWYFGEPEDATPSVVYGEGPHEVTYQTEGLKDLLMFVVGSDQQASYQGVVRVNASVSSTVEEDLKEMAPVVYPNPNLGNELFILSEKGISSVDILKTSGQQISSPPHWDGNKVDITNLSKGLYIIRIEQQDGSIYHKKLIKE
ncbi:S8 family serine peptidase [Flammeovirga agarivorans]|uniref:S8 family serine peptidase n=1 Tax=Flammeovirga agarivorans TaxID=2726742 RepID=A0A7X8SGE0_9BACT|nr:S8 family serine peptidase [Flammeovirga agarivorans]NLR89699.1 S8 family serine peptidase [Flammeovirga agarivorans]